MIISGEDVHGSARLWGAIAGHKTGHSSQSFGNYIQLQRLPIVVDGSCGYAHASCDRILGLKTNWTGRNEGEIKASGIGAAVCGDLPYQPLACEKPHDAEWNRSSFVRLQEMSLHRAGAGELHHHIHCGAVTGQHRRSAATAAEDVRYFYGEWPFKYLLESNSSLVCRLYRVFLHRVGEVVLRQANIGAIYRQIGTVHHLHGNCSTALQTEIMRHVLPGAQEDLLLCNPAADRIAQGNRVSSFRKDFGECKMAVCIRGYGNVRQRPVGSDLHSRSRWGNAVRQENVAGKDAGNGIHQLQIEVDCLTRRYQHSLRAYLRREEDL